MSIPAFIESPRLELPRGWVYDVGPDYDVSIIRRGRGRERRNLNADYPRVRIRVMILRDRVSDILSIRNFYHAVRGRAVGFRVQDPTDYLSTQVGCIVDDESPQPSPTDQPLIHIEDNDYQLVKQYVIGEGSLTTIQERPIVKPVVGKIRVANEFGVEQPAESWVLDYTTGIVTPLPGFVGVPTFWGGEFDTPMRFDSPLPLRVQDFRIDETSFELLELLDEAD